MAERARTIAIFALQCRGQATQCDEQVKERLNDLVGQLVPPRTVADAAWLGPAGNIVVPYLKYAYRGGQVQVACVRTLKIIGTPEARAALIGYRDDSRTSVHKELLGVIDLNPELVKELNLTFRRVSDLRPLANLNKLESLELWGTQVEDLAPLAGLTALRRLVLAYTPVSDLRPLARLRNLRELNIMRTAVTDLTPISKLTQLLALNISGTKIEDLSPIRELRYLDDLSIGNTPVTNLEPLASLSQLRFLYVKGVKASLACIPAREGLQIIK